MYFSAQHIDIKLNQDHSNFINDVDYSALVLCDGIGEFADSGKIAELVSELMIEKHYDSIKQIVHDNQLLELNKRVIGGTTVLFGKRLRDALHIEYLGNGGILHLNGDYFLTGTERVPYEYSNLMLPHVSSTGALTRHISHHSLKNELIPCKLDLSLNSSEGDIILMYTDGINSIEDNIILKDDNDRYWRHESTAVHYILEKLHEFLHVNCHEKELYEKLIDFNHSILYDLKDKDLLDDDASLGIIITQEVFEFYKGLMND